MEPIANVYIDPINTENSVEISGGKIHIKRKNNEFIIKKYYSIDYPQSKITIVTSAAGKSVVGIYVNSDMQTSAFQAVSVL